jgi:hypothetical protein
VKGFSQPKIAVVQMMQQLVNQSAHVGLEGDDSSLRPSPHPQLDEWLLPFLPGGQTVVLGPGPVHRTTGLHLHAHRADAKGLGHRQGEFDSGRLQTLQVPGAEGLLHSIHSVPNIQTGFLRERETLDLVALAIVPLLTPRELVVKFERQRSVTPSCRFDLINKILCVLWPVAVDRATMSFQCHRILFQIGAKFPAYIELFRIKKSIIVGNYGSRRRQGFRLRQRLWRDKMAAQEAQGARKV